jgi:hypothetical protein
VGQRERERESERARVIERKGEGEMIIDRNILHSVGILREFARCG